jgi:glucokinase
MAQLRAGGFLLEGQSADITVIAVAGPVERGTYCDPPYVSWDIDLERREIADLFGKTLLINDFVAQAYACRSPVAASARSILPGDSATDAVIGVLGAGTALGKAILVPQTGGDYRALPSEGGHAYFPFRTPREFAFQEFYRRKSGEQHITGNLVVSGRGLKYLHWFLTGEDLSPEAVTERLTPGSETLAWAAAFYGRTCRDFALEVLARGGLYVAGGLAARTPALLTHDQFRNAFHDSPTMGRFLAGLPVFLLYNQDSGLWGAAYHGKQILQSTQGSEKLTNEYK